MMKSKLFLAASVLALAVTGSAFAEDDPMQDVYENTLQIVHEGQTTLIYVNADGTYTTDTGTEGTWASSESGFCFNNTTTTKQTCLSSTGERRAVGESWESTSSDGSQTATMTLVAGR